MREIEGVCFNEALNGVRLLAGVADEAVGLLNELDLNLDGSWVEGDFDEWRERVAAFLKEVNA